MSGYIGKMIDKVKNFKQFVNENYVQQTTFTFGIGQNHKSNQNDILNYRKIGKLLKENTPITIEYRDGDSSMARQICVANIKLQEGTTDRVEYECKPYIETKSNLSAIENVDTINGALQIIEGYAKSIYDDRVE